MDSRLERIIAFARSKGCHTYFGVTFYNEPKDAVTGPGLPMVTTDQWWTCEIMEGDVYVYLSRSNWLELLDAVEQKLGEYGYIAA